MQTRAPDEYMPSDESDDDLEHAATEWFFRRDRGFTSREELEFARWMSADEKRATAFAELERSWREFGRLGEQPGAAPLHDDRLSSRSKTARAKRTSKIVWLRTASLAAAAIVAFALFLSQRSGRVDSPATQIVSAERGMTRTVNLPDGSSVQLNTESTIEVRFSSQERGVRLVRGEAHFTVMRNPAQPFVVYVGEVGVRAVGTAFNVRVQPEGFEVLVTEGTVRVIPRPGFVGFVADGGKGLAELIAGQRALIPARGPAPSNIAVVEVPAAQIEQAMSWHARRLEYSDASLETIVADFNRYNEHKLVIADARLAQRRFGATFPAGDYESLVRLLESTFGVVADRRENETVLRLP